MKIGLFTDPRNICYNSVNYFTECIEKALNYWGINTERIPVVTNELYNKSWDAIIGFNSTAPSVKSEDGFFFMNLFKCPMFDLLLDPPYHHHLTLESHMENLHIIVLDTGHAEYCKRYYPAFKSVETAYLLGPAVTPQSYESKTIDVLFSGTYQSMNPEKLGRDPLKISDNEIQNEFFCSLVQFRIQHSELSTLEALIALLKQRNIPYSDSTLKKMMAIYGINSDYYLRSYYREKIITTLIDAGVPVHLAGAGWENLYPTCPDNLILEGTLDFDQTADLMARSKIVLNIMPWKDGIHDRVLTAMANGSLCLTNSSSYIDSHFENGKDIALFDINTIDALPRQINSLLKNPALIKSISDAGYKKVQENYTWERFAQKYIIEPLLT